MKFTFLGTGNSANVPAYGCSCPACERAFQDNRFQRYSASALLQTSEVTLLIDAGLPDLGRRFAAGSFHTILLTHYHMDHVQGLFPIRWGEGLKLQVIGPNDPKGCDDLYKHPGILDFSTKAQAFQRMSFADLDITPVPLQHSRPTLGYFIEYQGHGLAYLTDTVGLPEETEVFLKNKPVDVLVLDCSFAPRAQAPKGHNDLTRALQTIAALNPKLTYLTHIDHTFDHWLMANAESLPDGVSIARDNQVVEL